MRKIIAPLLLAALLSACAVRPETAWREAEEALAAASLPDGCDPRELILESGILDFLNKGENPGPYTVESLSEWLTVIQTDEGPLAEDPRAKFSLLDMGGIVGAFLMVEHNGERDYYPLEGGAADYAFALADVDGDGAVEVITRMTLNGGYPVGRGVLRLTENGWDVLFNGDAFPSDPRITYEDGWRYTFTDKAAGFQASFTGQSVWDIISFDRLGHPIERETAVNRSFRVNRMESFDPVDADGDGVCEIFSETVISSDAYGIWGLYGWLLRYDPATDDMRPALAALGTEDRLVFAGHDAAIPNGVSFREAFLQACADRAENEGNPPAGR